MTDIIMPKLIDKVEQEAEPVAASRSLNGGTAKVADGMGERLPREATPESAEGFISDLTSRPDVRAFLKRLAER